MVENSSAYSKLIMLTVLHNIGSVGKECGIKKHDLNQKYMQFQTIDSKELPDNISVGYHYTTGNTNTDFL